jgi:hypothetical protein
VSLAVAPVLIGTAVWLFIPASNMGGVDYTYTDGSDFGFDVSPRRNALTKLSPVEERPLLDQITSELGQKSNAELFRMKAYDDVCMNHLVNCFGLASVKVKPFIDAILSDRQDRQAIETALWTRYIAIFSLIIAIFSLIVSIFDPAKYIWGKSGDK